jgi:hypothetical protein
VEHAEGMLIELFKPTAESLLAVGSFAPGLGRLARAPQCPCGGHCGEACRQERQHVGPCPPTGALETSCVAADVRKPKPGWNQWFKAVTATPTAR